MNTNQFLSELRTAMRDSTGRSMLDAFWYYKQFALSTGEICGFIARTDGKYRAYVYIPANIVPGISWGQAVVLETAGKGRDHFIGTVCPIVFFDGKKWYVAIPKKIPGRIANWGNPVLEAPRFSADNAQKLPGKVITVGKQYSNSAVITGWYANARKNKIGKGGVIKSCVAIVGVKSEDYGWKTVKQYIRTSPESMTITALAKATVKGVIDF